MENPVQEPEPKEVPPVDNGPPAQEVPAVLQEESQILDHPSRVKTEHDLANLVKSLLSNPIKLLEVDYSALANFEVTANDMNTSLDLITRINHFVNSNVRVFTAKLDSLTFSIFIVGLTSAAKDVTSAQLLGNKNLAVSGIDMCTAANVHLFVTPSKSQEQYEVKFKQETKIMDNGGEFLHHMQQLMTNIRNSEENKFSPNSVIVRYSGEGVLQSSYGLNTIGLIPRSEGNDPIFKMINAQLNEKAEGGGIIVICSEIMRPLDGSTAWLDFDVVKKWVNSRKQCKFQVILAITKADTLTENHFGNIKTMRDMYEKIFGRYEKLLPNTPMFAITGWIADNGSDEEEIAARHRDIVFKVMDKIENITPAEANSPFKARILERIGIDSLKKYYFEAIYSQSVNYLTAIVDGFKSGLENLNRFSVDLHTQLNMVNNGALPIHDHLIEIEKTSMIIRMNEHQRPSSDVSLENIEKETPNYRFTLENELKRIIQANPDIQLSPSYDVIHQRLSRSSLQINKEAYHAFWVLMERLHANSGTFASLYELDEITREEIIAYITVNSAKNSQDVENYIIMKALYKCKEVFVNELVPLFSAWMAQLCYDSYKMALEVSIKAKKYQLLANNSNYLELLEDVIKKEYFTNIKDLIAYQPKRNTVAFMERIDTDRNALKLLKTNADISKKKEKSLQKASKALGIAVDALKIQSSIIVDVFKAANNNLDDNLNKNNSKLFNPKQFATLADKEVAELNVIGKDHFRSLLATVLDTFFREAQTSLDWLYNKASYENQSKILVKWFYLESLNVCKSNNHDLFKKHQAQIRKIPSNRRFRGFTIEQLLARGMVQITENLFGDQDSEKEEGEETKKKENEYAELFEDLDFTKIIANDTLTYNLPSACLPGHNYELDKEYYLIAIQFLIEMYQNNQQLKEELLDKANKTKTARIALHEFSEQLSKYISKSKRK